MLRMSVPELDNHRLFLPVSGKCRFEELAELPDDLLDVLRLDRRLGRVEVVSRTGLT